MGHPEWLVAVVVLVVYGLGAILKAKQQVDAKPQQPAQRNPGQQLDRFLQEIDRLRRQQENRSATTVRKTEDDDETPTAQMAAVVVREQRPAPVLPRPVVLRVQAAQAPQPQQRPQAKEPEPMARTAQVVLPSHAPNVASARGSGPNPAVMALHMLRSRKSVSTAFVLNEILGPPKCKRT
jgi:hypothetical protein